MKRSILFITVLFTFISAKAQMQMGVELGLGNGSFHTSNMYTREKTMFKAGVFINSSLFDKNRRDIWETGLYYQQKGSMLTNFEEPATNYIHTMNITLNYIQVPLMTGYKFAISSESNFSVKIGIYGAYAFSASGDLSGYNNNELFHHKIDKLFTCEQFALNNQNYALKKFTPWDFGSIVMLDLGLFKNKLKLRYTIETGAINLAGYDKHLRNQVETFGIAYNFK